MESTRPLNVTRRVEMTGGLLGALSGESQGKALERVLPELNAEGYRVVFVLKDQWNIFKKLFFLLVLIVTLGIYGKVENILIVGERVEDELKNPVGGEDVVTGT